MEFTFSGEIIFWRGPAPWFFIAMPEEESRELKAMSHAATYGWGVIPVVVQIGATEYKTSLFPKNNLYLVPIRASVRKAEHLEQGDEVTVRLEVKFRV